MSAKFPLLARRGGCAIKKKAAFLAGADGVVDQENQRLLDLPPRRSRSKTIARVFPSCPGGEICLADTLSLLLLGQALKSGPADFRRYAAKEI